MRFLVDAQLPPALAAWLRERGHDAQHVGVLDLLAATDAVIAQAAERGGYVLVTKDEDFLRLRLPDRFALLWLRLGDATNRTLLGWLDARWPAVEKMLSAGERVIELR